MIDLAIVHDHLVQKGGAERVVSAFCDAFPGAPVYTAVYEPSLTYEELAKADIRTLAMNRVPLFRRRHRLAMPLFAPSFSHLKVNSLVTLCSSIGWAHGVRTSGRKLVYCHGLARWLYQPNWYIDKGAWGARTAIAALGPSLRGWDKRAAASANRYLVNSRAIQAQVASVYGIEAEVVHPPVSLETAGAANELRGVPPGFFLCVARLLPYKNVAAVIEAFARLPQERLVVVGAGPLRDKLENFAGRNVKLVGMVDEAALRWLYRSCQAVIAAAYEDFGLTPLEAAAHGKPAAVLRWGGFLDTVREGQTGVFFDEPGPGQIAEAIRVLRRTVWDEQLLTRHAELFSTEHFVQRMRSVVAEELALAG